MEHIKRENLVAYSENLQPYELQVEVESHLEACDTCFSAYLEILENQSVPEISESFTSDTIQLIQKHQPMVESKQAYITRNNTVVHYLLAAGLTIVLMVTGAFQGFLNITDSSNFENNASLTNHLMDKTNGILDQMKGER